jgi:hypothetical protein
VHIELALGGAEADASSVDQRTLWATESKQLYQMV